MTRRVSTWRLSRFETKVRRGLSLSKAEFRQAVEIVDRLLDRQTGTVEEFNQDVYRAMRAWPYLRGLIISASAIGHGMVGDQMVFN
jgi:hypothetical protein